MRRWIANCLVRLARRIYPGSPEVVAFYADRMVEAAITGQSWIKVKVERPYENEK